MNNQKSAHFPISAFAAIACFVFGSVAFAGIASANSSENPQDQDITLPAAKVDKPQIRLLKVIPGTLSANEINSLKIKLKFSDGGRNLKGGTFELKLTESNNYSHTITFDLDSNKFKRAKGKYAFTKNLILGNCTSVDVVARLMDSSKIKSKSKKLSINVTGFTDDGDDSGPKWGTMLNQRAENFTLLDHNDNQVSLHDYLGKVILLDISTMWCPPCQQEATDAEELYQKYKDQGFVILSVLFQDYGGSPATTSNCKTWANLYGLTFPVLADSDAEVWNLYDDSGYIPLNLIIDKEMVIQYKNPGYGDSTEEFFKQKIEELLAK